MGIQELLDSSDIHMTLKWVLNFSPWNFFMVFQSMTDKLADTKNLIALSLSFEFFTFFELTELYTFGFSS